MGGREKEDIETNFLSLYFQQSRGHGSQAGNRNLSNNLQLSRGVHHQEVHSENWHRVWSGGGGNNWQDEVLV